MSSYTCAMSLFLYALTARIRPTDGFVLRLGGIAQQNRPSYLTATRIDPSWDRPNNTAWDIPTYNDIERPTEWVDVDFHYDNPPAKKKATTKTSDDSDAEMIDPKMVDVIGPTKASSHKSSTDNKGDVFNGPFAGKSGSQAGYVPPFAHSRKGYASTANKADAKIDWNDIADKMAEAKEELQDLMDANKFDYHDSSSAANNGASRAGGRGASATKKKTTTPVDWSVGANGKASNAPPNSADVHFWRPPPPEKGGPPADLVDPSPNIPDVQNWRPPPPRKGGPKVDVSNGPFSGKSGSQAGSKPSCAYKRDVKVDWDVTPPNNNGHSQVDRGKQASAGTFDSRAAASSKNSDPQVDWKVESSGTSTSQSKWGASSANAADVRVHLEVPTAKNHKSQSDWEAPSTSNHNPQVDSYVSSEVKREAPPTNNQNPQVNSYASSEVQREVPPTNNHNAKVDWNDAPPANNHNAKSERDAPPANNRNPKVNSYTPSGDMGDTQVDWRASSANKADVKIHWDVRPAANNHKSQVNHDTTPAHNQNPQVDEDIPYYADVGQSQVDDSAPYVNNNDSQVNEGGSERHNMVDRLFGMRNRAPEQQQEHTASAPPPPADNREHALPHEVAMAKNWLMPRMGCVSEAHQEVYARKLVEYGCECVELLEMLVHEGDMERILKDAIGMKPFHFVMLLKGLNGDFRYNRRPPSAGRSLWQHVSRHDEFTEILNWLKAHMRGVPEGYLPAYATKLVEFGCDSVELIDMMIEDQYINTAEVLEGVIGMKPFHCKLLFHGLMG